MKLSYLAVPYSHPDKSVEQSRFNAVNDFAARLMRDGKIVFSPISHSHPIALSGELPTDAGYWERYNRFMIEQCSELIVLRLDGWRESIGVSQEIKWAEELGMHITFIDP